MAIARQEQRHAPAEQLARIAPEQCAHVGVEVAEHTELDEGDLVDHYAADGLDRHARLFLKLIGCLFALRLVGVPNALRCLRLEAHVQ